MTLSKRHVGFDTSGLSVNFKAHAGRGIGRYVQALSSAFKNLSSPHIDLGTFDFQTFALPALLDRTLNQVPLGKQTIRQQVFYPFQLSRGKMAKFDLIHFAAQTDAPSWCPKQFVLTVHDLIPLVCRTLYETPQNTLRFRFARWLELQAIGNAAHLIASSESTARDIERVLQVPPERISVVPLGVEDRFFQVPTIQQQEEVRERLHIPADRPVLLYVGGIDPRKNIPFLIRLHERLAAVYRERGEKEPLLAIAGKIESDKHYPELVQLISNLRLTSSVRLLGYVTDADLQCLYQLCSIFIFPSLYEGFGLPILEAMAAGIPVVSSQTSAMPEVLGDAALGFNPNNIEEALESVLRILDQEDLRNELMERGKIQARKFPWSRTAEKTLAVYEKILWHTSL